MVLFFELLVVRKKSFHQLSIINRPNMIECTNWLEKNDVLNMFFKRSLFYKDILHELHNVLQFVFHVFTLTERQKLACPYRNTRQ